MLFQQKLLLKSALHHFVYPTFVASHNNIFNGFFNISNSVIKCLNLMKRFTLVLFILVVAQFVYSVSDTTSNYLSLYEAHEKIRLM